MCLVKPQAGVLAAWALIRRRPRFLAGFAAVALPALILSIARAGLASHLEYLEVLSFLSRHGESFFPNQSVNGLLHRLLHNGENLTFFPPGTVLWMDHFPPYHRLVHVATMLSSALFLAIALWRPREARARGGDVDFMVAGLAATMASPIAWEHHYGVLLPMFVVARHVRARNPGLGGWTSWALGASWILTGTCWWVTRRLADDGAWNVLQSYVFFGGLLLFVLLWKAREGAGKWSSPTQLDDPDGGVGESRAVPGGGGQGRKAIRAVLMDERLVDGEVGDAVALGGGAGGCGVV
jgi:alpha-1,2-mannosyltransferase